MIKFWLPIIVALTLLFASACELNELPPDQAFGPVTTAELSLEDEAQVAGSVKVAAVVVTTGQVAGQATVRMRERSTVQLRLRPDLYLLHVHAFADTEARVFLGARSARLRMPNQARSPIKVWISANAVGTVAVGISGPDIQTLGDSQEGAVVGGGGAGSGPAATGASASGGAMASGSGGGSGSGSGGAGGAATAGGGAIAGGAGAGVSGGGAGGGSVSVGGGGAAVMGGAAAGGATAGAGAPVPAPLSVPVIDDVKVDVGDAVARIAIKASASAGGALRYIWSGAGFKTAVAGGATAEIPSGPLSGIAGQITSILVQSKDGVVAQVQVKFDITSQLRLGVLKLGGTARTSVVTSEALARTQKSCADVYERCEGGCKASEGEAQADCYLACGISLADCCEQSP
jgi:hypothetical protein